MGRAGDLRDPVGPKGWCVIAKKCLLHRSDRATVVGRFVKQELVDNEGVAPHRVEMIHNGIDAARVDPR